MFVPNVICYERTKAVDNNGMRRPWRINTWSRARSYQATSTTLAGSSDFNYFGRLVDFYPFDDFYYFGHTGRLLLLLLWSPPQVRPTPTPATIFTGVYDRVVLSSHHQSA